MAVVLENGMVGVSAEVMEVFPTMLGVSDYVYGGEVISMEAQLKSVENGVATYCVKRSDRGSRHEVQVRAELIINRGQEVAARFLLREHLCQYV